ncbi:MAG: hypothetical protein ACP5HK_01745 [Acidilobus sp.]
MSEVVASDEVRGDDVSGQQRSVVMYYAGIAGRTMQVYHTHRALSTAVEALRASMSLDFSPISIVVAPLTHVLGLQVSTLIPLASGVSDHDAEVGQQGSRKGAFILRY